MMPALDYQTPDQMRTDEAGAAGDKNIHLIEFFPRVSESGTALRSPDLDITVRMKKARQDHAEAGSACAERFAGNTSTLGGQARLKS
jgi:hypothetical protein